MDYSSREIRRIEEARQALLAYIRTGNIREAGREINVSPSAVYRRVRKARELLKAGKITLNCEICQ